MRGGGGHKATYFDFVLMLCSVTIYNCNIRQDYRNKHVQLI